MLIGLANLTNRVTGPLALELIPGGKALTHCQKSESDCEVNPGLNLCNLASASQNYSFVSYAPRHRSRSNTQQRDSVLAADAGQVLNGNVDLWRGTLEHGYRAAEIG